MLHDILSCLCVFISVSLCFFCLFFKRYELSKRYCHGCNQFAYCVYVQVFEKQHLQAVQYYLMADVSKHFVLVFGYITYGGEQCKYIYHMVKTANGNGICVGIHDIEHFENQMHGNFGIYNVLAPALTESSELDTFYEYLSTLTNGFIDNFGILCAKKQENKEQKENKKLKQIQKS